MTNLEHGREHIQIVFLTSKKFMKVPGYQVNPERLQFNLE